jgi:hypothetical protein
LVPYVGLVAYCWGLESIEGLEKVKKNAWNHEMVQHKC